MYFVPKYEVCYQKLLLPRKTKIDTIIVFDTEEEKIQQIINDKQQYGFNLIVLTNTTTPTKCNQVPCWNWFKEEIEIVNSL
jgi:tryptophan synthase alpha subunit